MNKITKSIKVFKSVILPTIAQKYRPFADQVISLFADRKIEKTKEAEKLLLQLSSRGLGPQSAIDKITKKYVKQESITGRLSRPTPKNIANKLKTFFVSGVIKATETYMNKLKKDGINKGTNISTIRTAICFTNQSKEQSRSRRKIHHKCRGILRINPIRPR